MRESVFDRISVKKIRENQRVRVRVKGAEWAQHSSSQAACAPAQAPHWPSLSLSPSVLAMRAKALAAASVTAGLDAVGGSSSATTMAVTTHAHMHATYIAHSVHTPLSQSLTRARQG